jgi:hypothetical protein
MPRKLAGDWQSRRPYGVRVAESFSESGAVRRFELCSEEKNMPTRLAKCPFAFDLSKPMPMVEALFGPGAKIVQGRAPQISARSTFDFTVFNHEVASVSRKLCASSSAVTTTDLARFETMIGDAKTQLIQLAEDYPILWTHPHLAGCSNQTLTN